MSCSCQNSSSCQSAQTDMGTYKRHKHHDHHECRPAGAFLSNTFPVATTLTVGTPIPLFPVAATPGFNFGSPGNVVVQECGTYVVTADITAGLLLITTPGTTLNIVKVGCRGTEVISSVNLPLAIAVGSIIVPQTTVCLQPGESIQLQLGGNNLAIGAGIVVTFDLIVSKISCCCELDDNCDRCDCPCKRC